MSVSKYFKTVGVCLCRYQLIYTLIVNGSQLVDVVDRYVHRLWLTHSYESMYIDTSNWITRFHEHVVPSLLIPPSRLCQLAYICRTQGYVNKCLFTIDCQTAYPSGVA